MRKDDQNMVRLLNEISEAPIPAPQSNQPGWNPKGIPNAQKLYISINDGDRGFNRGAYTWVWWTLNNPKAGVYFKVRAAVKYLVGVNDSFEEDVSSMMKFLLSPNFIKGKDATTMDEVAGQEQIMTLYKNIDEVYKSLIEDDLNPLDAKKAIQAIQKINESENVAVSWVTEGNHFNVEPRAEITVGGKWPILQDAPDDLGINLEDDMDRGDDDDDEDNEEQ